MKMLLWRWLCILGFGCFVRVPVRELCNLLAVRSNLDKMCLMRRISLVVGCSCLEACHTGSRVHEWLDSRRYSFSVVGCNSLPALDELCSRNYIFVVVDYSCLEAHYNSVTIRKSLCLTRYISVAVSCSSLGVRYGF